MAIPGQEMFGNWESPLYPKTELQIGTILATVQHRASLSMSTEVVTIRYEMMTKYDEFSASICWTTSSP